VSDLILTRELAKRGLTTYDVERMLRLRQFERVRRGAYGPLLPAEAGSEERHRRLILATAAMLGPEAVVSHGSAALLYGLPTWPSARRRVHVTRSRSSGGQRRSIVHVHPAPFASTDLQVIDRIVATSLGRTVLDLARTLPLHQAVAAWGPRAPDRARSSRARAGADSDEELAGRASGKALLRSARPAHREPR